MRKGFYAAFIGALFISTVSFATIRRVGYTGIFLPGVDYANTIVNPGFQTAHDDSSPGDTIQFYGTQVFGNPIITKRLVIIGFGYNFDANPNLQAIGTDNPSNLDFIKFDPGSENSIIEGCSGVFHVATSNIIIRRCNVMQLYFHVDLNIINNTLVESCVVAEAFMSGPINNPTTNTLFYNCIIQFLTFSLTTTTGSVINCVTQNVGDSWSFSDATFLVKNCIIGTYQDANINTIYENTFFGSAQPSPLPAGINNRWSQDWGVIFDRLGGTDDFPGYVNSASFDEDYYILKSGSPAINGGFNAANAPTDAGIYGGELAYRYKLSGVPPVPAIYKLTAPTNAATTNPYNITISVRSNN